MFDIRDLRHLLSIDEFRHFGRAAEAVGLSQPALTKSLQRIEQALGAKLFERSRAGVVPTTIGLEVLQRARRRVAEATDLKRTIDVMTGAEAGAVTIGVGPAMAETYLAQAIAEVVSRRPQTQVAIRVDHWQQLSDWLLAGEIDMYIADVGEAQVDRRFHHLSLPPQAFVWFCRSAHPLAKHRRKKVTRKELLQYPIATPKMPLWATEWFASALGDQGVAGLPCPFPAIECESYAMLKRMVAASDCISAALRQTLANELDKGVLAILSVDAPELTTQSGIVTLADSTPTSLASELIDAVVRTASLAHLGK